MILTASVVRNSRNIPISLIFRLLTDAPDETRTESSRNLSAMAWFRKLSKRESKLPRIAGTHNAVTAVTERLRRSPLRFSMTAPQRRSIHP